MVKEDNYDLKYRMIYFTSLLEKTADAVIPEDDKCECPICKSKFPIFLPVGVRVRANAQCPVCGSLERHRALWMFCEERQIFCTGGRLLHFAPEPIFHRKFSSMKNIDYWPVDINENMPGIRKAVDITDIPFEDNSIDMIVCNHVLEHIMDEKKALSELHRVLKPEGFAFLNVPILREKTLEKPEYNTPELRFKYYGQHDHVRAYGKDYPVRLRSSGFNVEDIEFGRGFERNVLRKYGLVEDEKIYLCKKRE